MLPLAHNPAMVAYAFALTFAAAALPFALLAPRLLLLALPSKPHGLPPALSAPKRGALLVLTMLLNGLGLGSGAIAALFVKLAQSPPASGGTAPFVTSVALFLALEALIYALRLRALSRTTS